MIKEIGVLMACAGIVIPPLEFLMFMFLLERGEIRNRFKLLTLLSWMFWGVLVATVGIAAWKTGDSGLGGIYFALECVAFVFMVRFAYKDARRLHESDMRLQAQRLEDIHLARIAKQYNL